jgi:hypothetical protein
LINHIESTVLQPGDLLFKGFLLMELIEMLMAVGIIALITFQSHMMEK